VFAEKGFYRANVADICKKAGISNGALYKYFKNKEDVFLAVFDRVVDLFSIDYENEKFLSSRKSIYDKLKALLEDIIGLSARHANYIAVYLDLGSPSMSKFALSLSETIEDPSKALWNRLVREGKERGEVDPGIAENMASYIIDNHVMLFMFSCVSEHYDRRFNSYFGKNTSNLTNEEKIHTVLTSIRTLLGQRT